MTDYDTFAPGEYAWPLLTSRERQREQERMHSDSKPSRQRRATVLHSLAFALTVAMLLAAIIVVARNPLLPQIVIENRPYEETTEMADYLSLQLSRISAYTTEKVHQAWFRQDPEAARKADRFERIVRYPQGQELSSDDTTPVLFRLDIQPSDAVRADMDAQIAKLANHKYGRLITYDGKGVITLTTFGRIGSIAEQYAPELSALSFYAQEESPIAYRLLVYSDDANPVPAVLQASQEHYQTYRINRNGYLIVGGIGLLIFLGIWLYLLVRSGLPNRRMAWIDRLPVELLALLLLFGLLLPLMRGDFSANWRSVFFFENLGVYIILAYISIGILLLSATRRTRLGIWRQTSLIVQISRYLRRLYASRSLFWQIILLGAALVLGTLFFYGQHVEWTYLLVTWLTLLVVFVPLIRFAVHFATVRRAASQLGQSDVPLNLQGMPANLKGLARDLSSIDVRIHEAVGEQMKSERLKTDLISNVSHDLKTPLTSIISYIDLLKINADDPAKRAEYLGILEQKTLRLKTLSENLIEAAKATSGAVPIQLSAVRLDELVHQAAAEYESRFQAGQLTLIASGPHTGDGQPVAVVIESDGRQIWRVLDNLLDNACKYALPGSRVYLSLQLEAGQVVIELRNVSREPLNISIDELMQRFVRGDASRTEQGSGLGLAIAKSLTERLGGTLDIQIDCDVFKARIIFPRKG